MKAAFCLIATFAMASPALAQNLLDTVFPGGTGCYQRVYSTDHLAGHPDQMVTQIAFGSTKYSPEISGSFVTRLELTLRGESERYVEVAYCRGEGDHLSCGIEGDGGGFTLKPAKGGAVLLTVAKDGMHFEGYKFISISGVTGDDRSFLMPPVSRTGVGACP